RGCDHGTGQFEKVGRKTAGRGELRGQERRRGRIADLQGIGGEPGDGGGLLDRDRVGRFVLVAVAPGQGREQDRRPGKKQSGTNHVTPSFQSWASSHSGTRARASPSFPGSLPPAVASPGFPPPLPPATFATSRTRLSARSFPAWTRSSVTSARKETFPSKR